ncbi:MAG: isoamylase early set domain-containing protein [Gemmatimonadaceae bacterium]|nr:isoamylase early set domain-containing protein [Gemmatimonadaceae bacterium]
MTHDHQSPHTTEDDFLARAREVLTSLPPVNPRAVANIMSAIATDQPSWLVRWRRAMVYTVEQWGYVLSPTRRVMLVGVSAALVGFLARGTTEPRTVPTIAERTDSPAAAAAIGATSARGDVAQSQAQAGAATAVPVGATPSTTSMITVPVQFVLDARTVSSATTVHVVGDFNEWQTSATPMMREGSVWTATVPLVAGRHVYAFVIDGTRWITDPRQPVAADADFGRAGSVIIVQTP